MKGKDRFKIFFQLMDFVESLEISRIHSKVRLKVLFL